MLNEVAFDESGNTGADLLNPHQPVFSLASVCVSRELADELLDRIKTHQTKEVKFSRLRRTQSGRRRIMEFLSSPELTNSNALTTFFHKRYMIVTKFVDLLIETIAYEYGVDLYKNGANIATANLHFYCMPAFCGESRTITFLKRFVDMLRTQSPDSIDKFYKTAWILYENSNNHEYAESLAPILISEEYIEFILQNNNRNSLDPAISAFIQHCSFWGEQFGSHFDLVHDESKPIFQEKKMLEDLMSRGEDEKVVGYDRRSFVFPLRARGVKFGRSHEDPRLQAADLLASACAFWMDGFISPPKQHGFWEKLKACDIARFGQDGVWPTPEVTPEELDTEHRGGINAVDAMAEFLSKHRR